MNITKSARYVLPLALLALGACSSGSSGGGDGRRDLTARNSGYGTLSIGLIDAAITDVTEIWVEIAQVNVKPEDGQVLEFPLDPPLQVDLLTLDADNSEMLLDEEVVPAGHYNWIELELNADFDGMLDSYVVTTTGGMEEVELQQEELRVPSGSVRLVSGFTVTADQETSFLIDWDMRRGLVNPPGQPGFMLRPAFRIIDMTEFGTLSGTVATATITDDMACADDDADLDVGNAVYVFAGLDVEPDDIDGADPEPVATITVSPNEMGDYVYATILSPGDYTVTFTCQSGLDDPEADDTVAFADPVNVTLVADDEGPNEPVDF